MDKLKRILKGNFIAALKVSLVVGISLSVINQYHHILSLQFNTEVVIKLIMNFIIPFLVASYSRYTLIRENEINNQQSNMNML